ncbi:MAG TPA: TPM domain-containing protein [Bacteroidales bacterium]|nr:TPM domain-containing protein [Bacteroidales bacterium]HOK97957.1 TPM domain-containing protein [Bacteroidales bacterium]HPO64533.1 TPM domain-containing protein [Bacteroidales bacterium]
MRYLLENKNQVKPELSTLRFAWLILSFFYCTLLTGQDLPRPLNPPRLVNDFVGLLSAEQAARLEKDLVTFNDTTSTQIVVVIVNSLQGIDANYFAYKIGESWGVGQKGRNNGVVLLVKPKTSDSRGQVAISVGYGLEHVLTDALSKRIIEQQIIPFFRNNQYFEGIQAGVKAIMLASTGQYKAMPRKNGDFEGSPWFALGVLAFMFFAFFLSLIQSRNRRHTIGRHAHNDIPFWILWGSMLGGSGRSRGSDWGSFSSGSGGFGGFGGGSFGGGGASGSW